MAAKASTTDHQRRLAQLAASHSSMVSSHSHDLRAVELQEKRQSEGSLSGVANARRAAAIDPEGRPRPRGEGAGRAPASQRAAQGCADCAHRPSSAQQC